MNLSLLEQIALTFEVILFTSTFFGKARSFSEHTIAVRSYLPQRWRAVGTVGAIFTLAMDGAVVCCIFGVEDTSLVAYVGLTALAIYTVAAITKLLSNSDGQTCACGGLAGDHFLRPLIILRNCIYSAPWIGILLVGKRHGDVVTILKYVNFETITVNVVIAATVLITVNMVFTMMDNIRLVKRSNLTA